MGKEEKKMIRILLYKWVMECGICGGEMKQGENMEYENAGLYIFCIKIIFPPIF